MGFHFLRIAVRSFARNKLYAAINIVALSVAMACGILAYVNDSFSRNYDTFHQNSGDVYVFRSVSATDQGERHLGITPRPLGPALASDIPQIDRMTRIVAGYAPFRYDDRVFNQEIYFVDEAFADMFTFPALRGSLESLRDPSSMAITAKTAEKYFGGEDPIGKSLVLVSDEGELRPFKVGAVLKDIPSASSLRFDVLLPYASQQSLITSDQNWRAWSHETFVRCPASDAPQLLAEAANKYIGQQNTANPDFRLSRMYVTPLSEIADHSRDLSNDIFREGMHPAAVFAPGITAILLLLTACFNFMNTTLAFSALRLKEVGIRKVLGGTRRQLVLQFIGENLVLCSVALLIAIGLAEIIVPAYDSLWPEWEITLTYADNTGLFIFFGVLLFGMSVFSGGYPSLSVSRFSPVAIFQGRQVVEGRGWLTRAILTFQFALSALTVLTGIVFADNADFIESFDMGFDTKQTIVVPLQGTDAFASLRNETVRDPRVISVEGARHLVGYNQSTLPVRIDEQEQRLAVLSGGPGYLETMGMTLLQGRTFDESRGADRVEALVVSEKFVRDFGLAEPLGQRVMVDSIPYTIIGVVQDIYNRSIWRPMQASAIRLCPPDEFRYAVVRAGAGDVVAVQELIRDVWKRVAPNTPYEGFYQMEVLGDAVRVSSSIRIVFIYVAGVAIAIAVMGLFALSSLTIVRRTKEIGIRKVLGASVTSVIQLLNRPLMGILLTASLLAAVGGFFLMSIFLDSLYAYHIEPSIWHYLLAGGSILVVGLLTVSSQVYRVATGNPVESLRYE